MTNVAVSPGAAWVERAAAWLAPRRLRAQAIVLAFCLWGVCAADFSTPGLFDHVGNIKFQDVLPLYVSARLIAQGRAAEIYNDSITTAEMQAIVHRRAELLRLPYLYPPHVGLLFTPLTRFSFPVAARIWVAFCLLIYFGCVCLIWKSCSQLRPYAGIVALAAIAFPPLFHFFVRGQTSVLALACFTAAFLAFQAGNNFLAGIALGCLFLKPQFLVAIPLVLLLSLSWKALAGLAVSVSAQLALTWIHFGATLTREYFQLLLHPTRWISTAEPGVAAIQMHSLRAFWTLLIPWTEAPWPQAALVLYAASSLAVIAIAAAVWKSSAPVAIRFSALILVSLLANPHLFIYDLLALVPALLLLADWTHSNGNSPAFRLLLYVSFMLPLLGPLSRWTHLQLSVPAFAALLWLLLLQAQKGAGFARRSVQSGCGQG